MGSLALLNIAHTMSPLITSILMMFIMSVSTQVPDDWMSCDWFKDPNNAQYYYIFWDHAPEECKEEKIAEQCPAMPEWCKTIKCGQKSASQLIRICLSRAPACRHVLPKC